MNHTGGMDLQADPLIVAAWIKGWAIARGTALPVGIKDGFRVDVGWPEQKVRYVFPELNHTFRHLADTVFEPWILLKACVTPEQMRPCLPGRWLIQPPGFMMTCTVPMHPGKPALPAGYQLEIKDNLPVSEVNIYSDAGTLAASGYISFSDDFVIYDRIITQPEHRRRGLAGIVMKQLEMIGRNHGRDKGILVATDQGKVLYETLGWKLHALFSTALIPGSGHKV